MNTPTIWIIFPGIAAGLLYLLRRRKRAIHLTGLILALFLALLAWKLPTGGEISLGPFSWLPSLNLTDTMTVLGRRFILDATARPFLIFIYLGIALWFGGAYIARAGILFIPVGLAIAALLTAALAVEPFLYAALLIEMAALACTPILSPPGKPVGRGVLRFLTFQTLGVPFILYAGLLLSGVQTKPENPTLVIHIAILMILGFAFFTAIFPFHTWIPMIAEEANPYTAAFVFFFIPGIVSLFALEFLNRYPWLQAEPGVPVVLSFLGVLMVSIGGIWVAFQRNLARIMGYTAIVEIGLSLLAISLGTGSSANIPLQNLFFALFLPRGIGLALWSLALTSLQEHSKDLSFRNVQGLARRAPVAASSLLIAHFSLAGFPLLASFPVDIALWTALSSQSLSAALLVLLGFIGVLFAGARTLAVLVMGQENENWRIHEARPEIFFLGIGMGMIFLIGLLPQWFMPMMINMAQILRGAGG